MAFLDNSGDIILDAVLTDTGRARLAKGDGTFKIVKFALGDDEIDSEHYAAGSIDGTAIAADAVTGAKIADNAINSEHYTDGSIDTAHIGDSQVTNAKLASGAVSTGSIADDAVTAAKLSNSLGDLRLGVTHIGRDSNDCYHIDTNLHRWFLDGAEDMRLENDGDLHCEGDVIAYSTTISDATLKYNINPVEFALDKIKQLNGVTFNYFKGNKASAGLLAQDVEKVMPSAVSEKKLPLHTGDDKTYKTLHYDSMTAILVEAIKELTAKVKKLEEK